MSVCSPVEKDCDSRQAVTRAVGKMQTGSTTRGWQGRPRAECSSLLVLRAERIQMDARQSQMGLNETIKRIELNVQHYTMQRLTISAT